MGKCPKCDSAVTTVELEKVTLQAGLNIWNGISYVCPSCRYVLSVGFDPAALQGDIVSEIVEKLGRA
jgi:hypothetical protein